MIPAADPHVHSFQQVQFLSPIEASIRFLPEVILGILLSVLTGYLVHHFQTSHLLFLCLLLSTVSPLLMAIADPTWNWWYCVFWAVLLLALSGDGMVLHSLLSDVKADNFRPSLLSDLRCRYPHNH